TSTAHLNGSPTVVSSLPAPRPDFSFNVENQSENEKDNARIATAEKDVNDMLGGIHSDIHNAHTNPEAAGRVRLAFGDNWQTHHEQLKKDATALRDARITIKHSDPQRAEDHQYQDTLRREGRGPKEDDKKDFIAHVDRTGVNDESKPGIMWLGTGWHDDKDYGRANRAGTALHETVHAVLRGGDHMHND
ncbi:5263_t:CDS:2, partial [Acaulospora colombiana]